MGWRQRVKKPVPVSRQQNQLILAIDPATLHLLTKLAIQLVKLNAAKAPTTPVTPTQTIAANGTLSIPYGTISLSNDPRENVILTDKNGLVTPTGWLKELFVVNGTIFGANMDAKFAHSGDNSTGWQSFDNLPYAALRSVATTIITSSAVYSPLQPSG